MELAREPKLLASLAANAVGNEEELTKELDLLIASQEQEKKGWTA